MGKTFANTGATVVDSSGDLPAASAGLEGLMFFVKDSNKVMVCSGSSWVEVNDLDNEAGLPTDGAALSVLANGTNSAGARTDVAAGTDGHVLRRSGTSLGFGTVATAGIGDDQVTKGKLEQTLDNQLSWLPARSQVNHGSYATNATINFASSRFTAAPGVIVTMNTRGLVLAYAITSDPSTSGFIPEYSYPGTYLISWFAFQVP